MFSRVWKPDETLPLVFEIVLEECKFFDFLYRVSFYLKHHQTIFCSYFEQKYKKLEFSIKTVDQHFESWKICTFLKIDTLLSIMAYKRLFCI